MLPKPWGCRAPGAASPLQELGSRSLVSLGDKGLVATFASRAGQNPRPELRQPLCHEQPMECRPPAWHSTLPGEQLLLEWPVPSSSPARGMRMVGVGATAVQASQTRPSSMGHLP